MAAWVLGAWPGIRASEGGKADIGKAETLKAERRGVERQRRQHGLIILLGVCVSVMYPPVQNIVGG